MYGGNMKKILIIGCVALLVGCGSGNDVNIEELKQELSELQVQVENLSNEKVELMDQIKNISEEKMAFDTENAGLKEDLEACEQEKAALVIDNEALQTNLNTISVNTYEAQYNFDVRVLSIHEGKIRYVFEQATIPHAQNYTIIGYNAIKNNIHEEDNDTITLGNDDYEVTSLKIEGTVYNFKWSNIVWDAEFSDYEIEETLESFDELSDVRVDVKTVLPEGLPGQALTWENSQGETFGITLSYDGYGFEGNIIISE